MRQKSGEKIKISSIISNKRLASAIYDSVSSALEFPFVHLAGESTVQDIFKRSLDAAIRDISQHPKGILFQRLIKYGPYNPDVSKVLVSDGKTTLSDPECELCVEFIYSYMINRFKGELAELLALDPCISLVQRLQQERRLSLNVHLYWGGTVQEQRHNMEANTEYNEQWAGFAKGADGLIVERTSCQQTGSRNLLLIHGIVEVKSMAVSAKRILKQIKSHEARLAGGLKLGTEEWHSDNIDFRRGSNKENPDLIYISVIPSTWKLDREWRKVKVDYGNKMILSRYSKPKTVTHTEELEPNFWKITLAWSQEALNEAAYEMTFWYMSQVGIYTFRNGEKPKEWKDMTPEQAGYNAIKMMLYYIILRPLSERHMKLAVRLYNVYCFGYPLGTDSKEMLWPEDFKK